MKVTIRPETPGDHTTVRAVVTLAFGGEDEARLVETIRGSPEYVPELSLVAALDGDIVGHVMFSRMTVETESGPAPALALAPVSVRPEHQKAGIGSALIKKGPEQGRALGHGIVIVIGHPEYYPRFGFAPAGALGLDTSFQVPDAAFMALEVVPGALAGVRGMVRYPFAFRLP